MKSWILRVGSMVLLGLILGPIIGMLIAEYLSGDPGSFGAKEDGFVGFLYGLRVGPCVGLVLGLLLAFRKKNDTEGE
ncbi:MAG TPA: hypothetical protein EYF98_05285 [Planctomycetes bacterium]|nr:hypothetical protein [Planctomycetota bacterium]